MRLSLILPLMLAFGCFYGLGSYGLLDSNEGLYASIARNMLHGSGLIIPKLNGVSYIEKPPMLYWLSALSMAAFGENEAAARLPMAAATAVLAVAMAVFLRRKINETAGILAGLIIASSPGILLIGRTIYCDMLLTCFISIALMAFYRWYGEGRRGQLILCYGTLGLGVLSKGIIAVILSGGVAFCFLAGRKEWRRMRQALDPAGIALFLLIAAPWHIAAMMQEKDFAWFFFVNETILRFLDLREPHDYYNGPVWYYVPRLILYLLPWSLLAPLLYRRQRESNVTALGEPSLKRFLWVWFLFIFAFFSLSRSKANYYMIAGLPPLVMLLALRLQTLTSGRNAQGLWRWVMGVLAICGVMLLACLLNAGHYAFYTLIDPAMVVCAGLILAGGMLACWWWRHAPPRCVMILCLPAVAALLVLIPAAQRDEQNISQKQAALYLASQASGEIAVYEDFEEISALAFYLPRPITVIDSVSSDLLYGKRHRQRPGLFPGLEGWVMKTINEDVRLVVRNHTLALLRANLACLPEGASFCIEKQFQTLSILHHCPAN